MTPRPIRSVAVLVVSLLIAGCVGTGAPSRAPVSPIGPRPSLSPAASGSAAPGSGAIEDAALKEALLARFGDLVFCDPDVYPVARGDQASAALAHLPEMRADTAAWTVIAGRLGFAASTSPTGDMLVAAYRNWKMLRALSLTTSADGHAFDAVFRATGKASGGLTHVTGTVRDDGSIVVASEAPGTQPPCPICLARGTLISTPRGDVAVESLQVGDPVWTADAAGRRVAAVVEAIGSTPVPPTHEVVRLILADGRVVFVSPGHPLPDGRPVGSLAPGAPLDGSVVASADRLAYDGGRTFDLLPSGPTGTYWAGGILLGSTLAR